MKHAAEDERSRATTKMSISYIVGALVVLALVIGLIVRQRGSAPSQEEAPTGADATQGDSSGTEPESASVDRATAPHTENADSRNEEASRDRVATTPPPHVPDAASMELPEDERVVSVAMGGLVRDALQEYVSPRLTSCLTRAGRACSRDPVDLRLDIVGTPDATSLVTSPVIVVDRVAHDPELMDSCIADALVGFRYEAPIPPPSSRHTTLTLEVRECQFVGSVPPSIETGQGGSEVERGSDDGTGGMDVEELVDVARQGIRDQSGASIEACMNALRLPCDGFSYAIFVEREGDEVVVSTVHHASSVELPGSDEALSCFESQVAGMRIHVAHDSREANAVAALTLVSLCDVVGETEGGD